MNIKTGSKKNLFRRFLLYYESLFIITSVISTCLSSYMLHIMENEIYTMHDWVIRQQGRQMDASIAAYQNVLIELATEHKIETFVGYEKDLDAQLRQTMRVIQQTLNRPVASDSTIEMIYLYLPSKKYVLSHNGYSEKENFYTNYQNTLFESQGDWQDLLMRSSQSEIYQQNRKLLFTVSLPLGSVGKRDGILCMMVDAASLMQELQSSQNGYRSITGVIDQDNHFFLNDEQYRDKVEKILIQENKEKYAIDGASVLINRSESIIEGWSYISIVFTKDLLKNAIIARNMMIVTVLISSVIIFLLSMFLSYKNTRPILELKEELDDMTTSMHQYKQGVWQQHLRRLLKGYPLQPLPEGFGLFVQNKQLEEAWKAVVLIPVEKISDVHCVDTWRIEGNGEKRIPVIVDDYLCCIFLFDTNVDLQKLHNEAEKLCRDLKEENLPMGCSVAVRQNDMLTVAYEQARESLMYQQLTGGSGPVFAQRYKQNGSSAIPMYELIKLQNALKVENVTSTENIFDDITAQYLLGGSISVQMIKCNMYSIINAFVTVLGEANYEKDGLDADAVGEQLLSCASIDQFVSQIREILGWCSNQKNKEQKNSRQKQQEEMERFLLDHFRDPDFSVALMAQQFHIDPSHLSRRYKQLNHINLLDRIHQLKINEAKNLLIQTKMTIREISILVGYNTELTFLRAFKRQEGMTPTQFRELYEKPIA